MTDRPALLHICRLAVLGLALGGASACSENAGSNGQATVAPAATAATPGAAGRAPHAPNPSKAYPPSQAFAQFERIDAGKFHSTEQFTVFDSAAFPGSVDSIQYSYIYTNGRFDTVRKYNADVSLQVVKFPSAEQAKVFLDQAIAKSIPIADAATVKLPKCVGQKKGNDDFVGPSKLVKTLPHPRGGEIKVLTGGDFNMYDCTRGSNEDESAIWTDGEFYFLVDARKLKPSDVVKGRAEELALDYLAALGPSR